MKTLVDTATDGPGSFLKWAGNKGFLAKKHPHLVALPDPGSVWRESFCGSAGLFYTVPALQLGAVLTDCNPRLVATHVAVRDHVEDVVRILTETRAERHALEDVGKRDAVEAHYYRLRGLFNTSGISLVDTAALLIALNHLCVNGLYRENATGEFNVSMGTYEKPTIFDAEHLRACSRALATADVRVLECEAAIDQAEPGDSLLLDPPYAPVSATASFTGYSGAGDSGDWNALPVVEQIVMPGCDRKTKRERLADKLAELSARAVRATVTDSDTPTTRMIYARAGRRLTSILVGRSMNSKADRRQPVPELVVDNWG